MSRTSIEEYLQAQPPERLPRLQQLLELIRRLYPDAQESMRYKMPTYSCDTGWVAVANQKQYISLYTCSAEHLAPFKSKHPDIKTGKGCINFRNNDPLPLDDIEAVIRRAMGNSGAE